MLSPRFVPKTIDPGVVDVRGEVLARLASAQDTGHEAGAFLANFAADLRRSSPPGRASERGLNREAVVWLACAGSFLPFPKFGRSGRE